LHVPNCHAATALIWLVHHGACRKDTGGCAVRGTAGLVHVDGVTSQPNLGGLARATTVPGRTLPGWRVAAATLVASGSTAAKPQRHPGIARVNHLSSEEESQAAFRLHVSAKNLRLGSTGGGVLSPRG
jgi:hypothetical protein